MRNRFISNYIFESTGKRRTPKQVGSRLQQLRDTCRGKRLLALISNRNHSSPDTDSHASSRSPSSETSVPATSPSPTLSLPQSQPKRTFIFVDIPPGPAPWPSPYPVVSFTDDGCPSPLTVRFESPSLEYDVSAARTDSVGAQPSTSSQHSTIPVVTFSCSVSLHPQASFSVFLDGGCEPVHSDVVPLICRASPFQGSDWVYSTNLVPRCWNMLRDCPDPSRYTIVQDLIPTGGSSQDGAHPTSPDREPNDGGSVYSVMFRFKQPHASPVLPVTRHISNRPSNIDYLSENTDDSSQLSPSSISSVLYPPLSNDIGISLPLEEPQDTWISPQFYPTSQLDGNRYYDIMFSSCPDDYSLLSVPMISKTNRFSSATGNSAIGNSFGQRLIDQPTVQSWSSVMNPCPVYPTNYLL